MTIDQWEPRCNLIYTLIGQDVWLSTNENPDTNSSGLISVEQAEVLFFEQLPPKVNSISSVDIIRRDSLQIHLVKMFKSWPIRTQMQTHLRSDWSRCLILDHLESRYKLICVSLVEMFNSWPMRAHMQTHPGSDWSSFILWSTSSESKFNFFSWHHQERQMLNSWPIRTPMQTFPGSDWSSKKQKFLFFEQLPLKVNSISSVDIIRRDSPQIHLVLRQFHKFKFHSQSYFVHI